MQKYWKASLEICNSNSILTSNNIIFIPSNLYVIPDIYLGNLILKGFCVKLTFNVVLCLILILDF